MIVKLQFACLMLNQELTQPGGYVFFVTQLLWLEQIKNEDLVQFSLERKTYHKSFQR